MRGHAFLSVTLLLAACSDSTTPTFTDPPDAAKDATLDASPDVPGLDAPAPDVAADRAAADVPLFADGGSQTPVCRACAAQSDCGADGVCVAVATGQRACLPRCNPDVPVCPGRLRCVRDVALADVAVCAPIGGSCCIDGDGDGFGVGVGCRGADCDDTSAARNAGASEVCGNGADDDCDGMTDEGCVDAGPDATPDVPIDVARDVAPDAAPDATPDAAPDVPREAGGACDPAVVRWILPPGTTGGPDCITRGGGYCEGTAYCSGGSCYTTPPGGCGEPHCGTLRCNDGSYVRERYCSVRASCEGGSIVAGGFTW